MSSAPSQKPTSSTQGAPPPRVTSPPKAGPKAGQEGSLAQFMGKQLGVKYTGQSSGMIKKETHDDAADRAFHANKPANEAMARNFAAMVMSSAKPVGSVGMKLPSQIIKEQQGKGSSAAAPKTDTHVAEQKAKEEAKVANEKAERDKKEKADKELKAKAEAPKASASTTSSATLTKVSSTSAADKAKKEKEEREKKEKEEKEKKAKAEKEKAEKEKAEKEKKAKEQEEAKRKAIEASKRPASFGIDRSKSPGKPAATVLPVAPVKEEVRAKSASRDERPGSRPKSPEKVEIHKVKEEKHLEVVHEVAVSSSGGSGHTKLEKDRWYVEGYDGASHSDPIIVKVDSPKESVYIGKCTNGVVVQVEGKCKSLQVNSSHDVGLVCETVVATVEIMNSSKCQIQTTGTVNLIQLDNCDRCKLFLSKDALAADCKIFTAKSANTLVYTPTDDGEDMLEMSLPEQFISSMNEEGNAIRHEIVMPEAVLS